MIAPLFRQGDPVRKVGGTYEADGFVVGVAVTSRGDVRYVFEFVEPAGMLHIFNEGQLQAREGKPCAPAPEASAGPDTDGYWRDRYMRDVEGLNSEGDPIGGEPPVGLRQTAERQHQALQQMATKLEAAYANLELANVAFAFSLEQQGGNVTIACSDIARLNGRVVVGRREGDAITFELKAADDLSDGPSLH